MTPVGSIAIVIALIAGYLAIVKVPGLFVAAMTFALATFVHADAQRARNGLARIGDADAAPDPWGKADRSQQRLLRRSVRLTIRQTSITSMFPSVSGRAGDFAVRFA